MKRMTDKGGSYDFDDYVEGAKYAIDKAKDITAKAEANNPTVQRNKQEVKDSFDRAIDVMSNNLKKKRKKK